MAKVPYVRGGYPPVSKHARPSGKEFVKGGETKGREHRFQSGNAVFRRADPDNPFSANHQINMVCDYQDNMNVLPAAGFVKGLAGQDGKYRGMNADGKSAVMLPNITVGSGTDDKGSI